MKVIKAYLKYTWKWELITNIDLEVNERVVV